MSVIELPLGKIRKRIDARPLRSEVIPGLVSSIKEVGIINPLRVRPITIIESGRDAEGWEITAGRHRFEAATKAGLATVPCIISTDDDLRSELIMIDENLCRVDLTPAQAAQQVARRKEIYEELHPDTKYGANQFTRSRQVGDSSDRFTKETASSTGRSERALQRDAARGETLGEDFLARVEGTSLDKGVELDALVKMAPQEREKIVSLAEQGQKVSARKPVALAAEPLNDFEAQEKQVSALMSAWNKAGLEAREEFLSRIDKPLMDKRYG